MNTDEIVKLAAEAGAKAAMDRLEKERQRDRLEMADRRLRNTKLLLRNYRAFRDHAENAVYDAECNETIADILADLMMPGREIGICVESIKRSASRTAIIVQHMTTMMQLYQTHCAVYGNEEDNRRYRIIYGLYIGDKRVTIPELAKSEGVVERTIYKDIDIACEAIAALMFGIDGLKRK